MRGWRVLVTRPEAAELSRLLRARGAIPIAIPLIEIRSVDAGGKLDAAARAIGRYDWVVVTSANGARALIERMRTLGIRLPESVRWAAVGPATAAELGAGGVRVTAVPRAATGAAIAGELGALAGARVLLPRSRIAAEDLPAALAVRGARVDEVPAYETVIGPESSRGPLAAALDAGLEAAIFTSGSTVAGFVRLAGDASVALAGVTTVCIGPATARALEGVGVRPARIAARRSAESLVHALEEVAHARA
ncbi:MAG TPA: uroporphyrinogen-III synthase [Gemmatimonadota bacterium]|jgi:uroporphyrinogen-III synthase